MAVKNLEPADHNQMQTWQNIACGILGYAVCLAGTVCALPFVGIYKSIHHGWTPKVWIIKTVILHKNPISLILKHP